jgi:hypothetical protein
MNIKEFQELLGLNQYRNVPLEHLDSTELRPMSKSRMNAAIEQYLIEYKIAVLDRLTNQSAVVASAWGDGIILLLDDKFVFLYLINHRDKFGRHTDSYFLGVWDPDDYELPVDRFGEAALAKLLHPAIAAEYAALSEDEENYKRQEQADKLARGKAQAIAKAWARYGELQAEMEALKIQIDGGAIDE